MEGGGGAPPRAWVPHAPRAAGAAPQCLHIRYRGIKMGSDGKLKDVSGMRRALIIYQTFVVSAFDVRNEWKWKLKSLFDSCNTEPEKLDSQF